MISYDFDKDWAFSYSTGNAYRDRKGAAYKKTVNLPHDFMISTERTPDAPMEGAGGFFQGGIGTYEKYFSLEESQKGHPFLLLIEGSYGNTEVWINGSMAALHHYGYTEFYADLTKWLKFGEQNKLKIVVENNAHPNSRWYSGSGLYRHVRLLEGASVYLAPWSVGIQTPDLRTIQADVTLTKAAAMQQGSECEVALSILDSEGNCIAEQTKIVVCNAAETTCHFAFSQDGLLPWSLEHPYLYRAAVRVRETGKATDAASDDVAQIPEETKEVCFGVRTLSFTRERGFCLNEVPVKLKGGCIHHDNGVVGSCAFDEMEYRRVRLLKESGYNAIRTSHNPPSTALLDACDRLGMLVMDEAFDCWRAKKNPFDYHLYFEDHWKEDLTSMVLRDRNHPSVIMYSIGNEIGERDGSGNGPEISAAMCAYVRSLDSTRAITNGVCAVFLDAGEFGGILANIFGSGEEIDFAGLPDEVKAFLAQADEVTKNWGAITADYVKDLDVVGYNYLVDRYTQDGVDFPERIIVGTESYPKAMKQVWAHTMAHPYVIGDFTWTAMDYLGESGIGHAFYDQQGGLFCDYPWHTGNCGDFDICGYLRPQGKFRRLLWGTDHAPVITILHPEHIGKKESISIWGWADVYESYTWPGYEGKEIRADLYSDADEIEVKVNGRRICRKAVPDSGIVSLSLTYEPGTIEAINYRGGLEAEHSTLSTAGEAVSIKLTLDNYSEADPAKWLCEGKNRDLLILQAEAVDKDRNRVPSWENEVFCEISGAGELSGFGSGNPQSEDNYTLGRCHFFEGRALLVVRRTKEQKAIQIQLKETCEEGISSEKITF
ncbi:MAG: DUF4982 domain-containing protein [Lachnospiraceae bacterium]|nr:DUF4982 domain-containing protein [Lachnospiraceae bacterium]